MNELNRGQSCLETYGLFSNLTFFFFQAEDGIRDHCVTGVQTCALPISAEHVEVCVPEKTAGILPKRPEPAPCQKKARSEERRVGKECRTRWTQDHRKKKNKETSGLVVNVTHEREKHRASRVSNTYRQTQ